MHQVVSSSFDPRNYDPSDYEEPCCNWCEHFVPLTEGKEERGCCKLRMLDYLDSMGKLRGQRPTQLVDSVLDYICMSESDGTERTCDEYREA